MLKQASGPANLVFIPSSTVLYRGEQRYAFGVYTRSARDQVTDAQVALYVAKAPPPGRLPQPKANGATARPARGPVSGLSASLVNPARGPFPARIESLQTLPAFRSASTSDDPDAGKAVYVTRIDFPGNGDWRIGALVKDGNKLTASVLPGLTVGKFHDIPRVGQRPPDIHTPTRSSVGGDLRKLTTRVPPERMNGTDFHDVLGKKPIVLLFATPKFCQSRVCSPVVDEAAQVQREIGDKVEFIHMEIYNDNQPAKGVRPQVRAFHLPSEPWLFVIDRSGVIRTVIEGAFDVRELSDAVRAVAR